MTEPARAARQQSPLRPAIEAGLVAFLLGLLAQWLAHRNNVVFAFWDAQAHLDIARRLFDSTTPGLQMLGTVWLPVPHLLLAPFTLVDAWWWNGLAGGIVGLLAYTATAIALHDLLRRRCADRRIARIGTLLLLANPSLLYLQTTAMTEPLLLAFLVGAVAMLDRWAESGRNATLLWAGVLTALAVGTRYDGWFVCLMALPWTAWVAHRQGWSVPREMIRFAWPAALMVALWLGYNAWYFGDPLEFQRGAWSAQSQQAALAASGQLPTSGHPLRSLLTYLGAAGLTAGWLLLPAGLLALGLLRGAGRATGSVLLLLAALPFNVLALWGGQSAISLPWTTPAGLMNPRYGTMMLPGLVAAVALGVDQWLRRVPGARRGTLLALSLLTIGQGGLWLLDWPAHAGALREGVAIRDGDQRQQHASDWLAAHYDGGRVLVDDAVNLSPRTRIPIRSRIYQWSWEIGPKALAEPEREVDWVVVDQHHAGNPVSRAIAERPSFRERFDRTFADDGLEIWRRR